MTRNTYIVICLSAFLFSSCTKKLEDYKVEGTITDVYTGRPLTNAEVTMFIQYELEYRGGTSLQYRDGNHAYTDANGHYEFMISDMRRKKETDKDYNFAVFSDATMEGATGFGGSPDYSSQTQELNVQGHGR